VIRPQTTRNGVVAIDPHPTRSGVAWDHSLAGTNDDKSRFGMMPSCAAFAEAQRAIKRHNAKPERIAFSPTRLRLANHPCCYVVRGRTVVTGNGLQIAKIGMIVGLN
jgi:hypothetical protein